MIAVLQRVDRATVRAEGEPVGAVGRGLLILLGVAKDDSEADAALLAKKIAACRIFTDEADKMNLSVRDVSGEALVISNFTLLADYRHGNRPSYFDAAPPADAERLYLYFMELMKKELVPVVGGRFGAHMDIEIAANGPVTIVLDSRVLQKKRGGVRV